MSPVLSAETWAIMLTAAGTAVLTAAIRWLWRRRKDLGDL
jgi:LPXTG-motif cell wall-anchored protein